MTNEERRTWLEGLSWPQLIALCHKAGVYGQTRNCSRGVVVRKLASIEGIETPEEA